MAQIIDLGMACVYRSGLPEKQADLVGEMQDWFIAASTDGDAPDESTIRKRVSPIWRLLHAEGVVAELTF